MNVRLRREYAHMMRAGRAIMRRHAVARNAAELAASFAFVFTMLALGLPGAGHVEAGEGCAIVAGLATLALLDALAIIGRSAAALDEAGRAYLRLQEKAVRDDARRLRDFVCDEEMRIATIGHLRAAVAGFPEAEAGGAAA